MILPYFLSLSYRKPTCNVVVKSKVKFTSTHLPLPPSMFCKMRAPLGHNGPHVNMHLKLLQGFFLCESDLTVCQVCLGDGDCFTKEMPICYSQMFMGLLVVINVFFIFTALYAYSCDY